MKLVYNALALLLSTTLPVWPSDAILGGMGTGYLHMGESGRIHSAAITTNPHRPVINPEGAFAAIQVQQGGQTTLRGLFTDEQSPYALDTIHVDAAYPLNTFTYDDDALPVEISLETFSPFLPGAMEESSLPGAVLRYTLSNPGTETLSIRLMQSIPNWIGTTGNPTLDSARQGEYRHQGIRSGALSGFRLSYETTSDHPAIRSALGEMALLTDADRDAVRMLSFLDTSDEQTFLSRLETDADLEAINTSMQRMDAAGSPPPAAVLSVDATLNPGESKDIRFYLTWHVPEWVDEDGTAHNKQYSEWYRDAVRTARTLADTWDDTHTRFLAWRDSMGLSIHQSHLVNGLRWLPVSSVLLDENRVGFLTTDDNFPGNIGSPEEYLLALPVLLVTFPDRLGAMLDPFAAAQLPEGEIPGSIASLDATWGRGNLPGGLLGRPDSSSAYTLLAYLQMLMQGDETTARRLSVPTRSALVWLSDQDRDGDFVPDGPSLFAGDTDSFSTFSAEMYAAAMRCGVEIGNRVSNISFSSNSQQILNRVIDHTFSYSWNGSTFLENDNEDSWPASMPGSALVGLWGWNPILGSDAQMLHTQTVRAMSPPPYGDSRLQGLVPYSPTGREPATQHPSLRHRALGDATLWWQWVSSHMTWYDTTYNSLILPSPPAGHESFSRTRLDTPWVDGTIEITSSLHGGHHDIRITLSESQLVGDNRLQQVALRFPLSAWAEPYTMRVFHNREPISGQDFIRERLRVFSFAEPRAIRSEDTLQIVLSPNQGGRIRLNPQTATAIRMGAQCDVLDIQPGDTSIRFDVVNALDHAQIVYLETTPDPANQWVLYFNDDETAWPATPGTQIPIVLQGGALSAREARWLERIEFACKASFQILTEEMPGIPQRIHERLWDLQTRIQDAISLERQSRGFRITLQKSGEPLEAERNSDTNDPDRIRNAYTEARVAVTEIREDISRLCPDPVLASKIMGSFAPIQHRISLPPITTSPEAIEASITLESFAEEPIPVRLTLSQNHTTEIISTGALQHNLTAGTTARIPVGLNPSRPLALDRIEIPFTISGTWQGTPFQMDSAIIAGHEPITQWSVIGPFPNPRGEGHTTQYPPETDVTLSEILETDDGILRWQDSSFPNGIVDFGGVLPADADGVAYAYVAIQAPRDIPSRLSLGGNGDIRVYFNFREIFARRNLVSLSPDTQSTPIRLMPGWNYLVVKLSHTFGAWAFQAEITDRDGKSIPGLTYSSTQD